MSAVRKKISSLVSISAKMASKPGFTRDASAKISSMPHAHPDPSPSM